MRVRGVRAAAGASITGLLLLLAIAPAARAADDLALTTPFTGGELPYDSSAFTVEAGEITDCPPGTTGGKSGWTRYDASVDGVLTIGVTADYDVILHTYTATTADPAAPGAFLDGGCADDDHSAGGTESRTLHIAAGRSVFVQTLGVAGAGGVTTVRLQFVADDADQDRVPNTLDACPATAGLQANGCPGAPPPDTDQDGIADGKDLCETLSGDLANGCPSHLYGDIRGRWQVNRLLTKLVSLVVEAPVGSRIQVRCSGRRGVCPFGRVLIARTTKPITNLTRYFGKRRLLPSNVSIYVRLTRTRQIGIYQHLVTRRDRRLPKVTRACINPDGRVVACT